MIHHREKKREKGGKHFENKTLAHVGILFFEMLAEKLPWVTCECWFTQAPGHHA
jgi:hypothetical protein